MNASTLRRCAVLALLALGGQVAFAVPIIQTVNRSVSATVSNSLGQAVSNTVARSGPGSFSEIVNSAVVDADAWSKQHSSVSPVGMHLQMEGIVNMGIYAGQGGTATYSQGSMYSLFEVTFDVNDPLPFTLTAVRNDFLPVTFIELFSASGKVALPWVYDFAPYYFIPSINTSGILQPEHYTLRVYQSFGFTHTGAGSGTGGTGYFFMDFTTPAPTGVPESGATLPTLAAAMILISVAHWRTRRAVTGHVNANRV
jgi:hypothetical protein